MKSSQEPSDSFETHMNFLENIEKDLNDQKSVNSEVSRVQKTVTHGKLRRLKSRFDNMQTLNAAGPTVLRGKAKTVRRRAMLEACVRDLAEVCGPNTKLMMEDGHKKVLRR